MMVNVGKWSFVGGVVLAIVAGFFTIPYALTILAVLGLIVGFLNISAKKSQEYLVAAIAIALAGLDYRPRR